MFPPGIPVDIRSSRKRLPEKMLKWLFEQTGESLTAEAETEQRWQGRCVKVLDGSTVVMADTAANQEEYPQHQNQKPEFSRHFLRKIGDRF